MKKVLFVVLALLTVLFLPPVGAATYGGYIEKWQIPWSFAGANLQSRFTDPDWGNKQFNCNDANINNNPCWWKSPSGDSIEIDPTKVSFGDATGGTLSWDWPDTDTDGDSNWTYQVSWNIHRATAGTSAASELQWNIHGLTVRITTTVTNQWACSFPGSGGFVQILDNSLDASGSFTITYNNVTNSVGSHDSFCGSFSATTAGPKTNTGASVTFSVAAGGNGLGFGSLGRMFYDGNDGHTFDLDDNEGEASEFDEGLKDFASGLGFVTPQSQTFFALILIAITEIVMAFFTGFFGEGKWRIWVIHGVASAVGVICVLLDYMEFWVLIVAIVLATSIVSGGRETINTLKKLASGVVRSAKSQFGKKAVDTESGATVEADDFEDGLTEIEGADDEDAPEIEVEEEVEAQEEQETVVPEEPEDEEDSD